MYEQQRDTQFKQKIRIKPAQLEWIKENKGNYTLAGKLDQIINHYKKWQERQRGKETQKQLRNSSAGTEESTQAKQIK